MKHYVYVLQNYALFTGRAGRSEYWYFFLFNFIISIVLGYVNHSIANIYSIAVLIPSIAVGIRRMHDVNKSGWFLLIPLYNFYLACIEGTKGANQYGEESQS